jgi:hypothetical protein
LEGELAFGLVLDEIQATIDLLLAALFDLSGLVGLFISDRHCDSSRFLVVPAIILARTR